MQLQAFVALALCAVSALAPAPVEAGPNKTPRIQAAPGKLRQTAQSAQRAAAVKASFEKSFAAYKKYAFGADSLLPLSLGRENNLGGWGASVVDALDTAHVMGLSTIERECNDFMLAVDYDNTNQTTISLFETNIRHLGGLLSYYELTGKRDERLVKQAERVGKHLLKGWVGANKIPVNTLPNWNSFGAPDPSDTTAGIAEAGTLLLEFSKLSKYTRNSTYLDHAYEAMDAIVKSNAVFPGLYAQDISVVTNEPTDDYVTWSGGSDSFFEYLSKYALLSGNSSSEFMSTWLNTIRSSITQLLTEPQGHAELLFLSDYSASNGGHIPQWSHLGCFAGGNWILGGRALGLDKVTQFGLRLAESCYATYNGSATGIGPETFAFKRADGSTNGVTIGNATQYAAHGWDYGAVDYVLRPEVMESVFYGWRATGDRRWQDYAWAAFQHIEKYCLSKSGALAALNDVSNPATAQLDDSESFLYAELYKYFYLIFADGDTLSLDRYVFNTEAHPFELDRPGAFAPRPSEPIPDLPAQPSSSASGVQPAAVPATTPARPGAVPQPAVTGVPAGLLEQVAGAARGAAAHARSMVKRKRIGHADAQHPLVA